MSAPGPQWATGYAAYARKTRIAVPLHRMDAAVELVGECFNPILAGHRNSGTWMPGHGWMR
jgi:hypothetical protein